MIDNESADYAEPEPAPSWLPATLTLAVIAIGLTAFETARAVDQNLSVE